MLKLFYIILICTINSMLMAASSSTATLLDITDIFENTQQSITFKLDQEVALPTPFINNNNLILDFNNTNNKVTPNMMLGAGFVHKLTVASIPNHTRIIILDAAKYRYQLLHIKSGVILTLTEAPTATINKKSGHLAYIKQINFHRDDNGGGVVEVNYTGNTKLALQKERIGDSLIVNINSVDYAKTVLKQLDVRDFGTPIKYLSIQNANGALRISITNRNNWDDAIYQLEHKLIINVRELNKTELNDSEIPSLKSNNNSEKVSFNFQNIDIRALLQMLAEFSGYNILVSDSVTGSMSIKLSNVPWSQALNTILSAKGLSMKREGNVIRIAPTSELAALSKQLQDSQKSFEAIEPLDTLTIRLKYAQADDVQTMILKPITIGCGTGGMSSNNCNTQQNSEILSQRGSILTDARTNTIIINDTPSKLKAFRELVEKIDIPVKQVLIEARIVEASSMFERDLGTRLLLAGVSGSITVANTLENGVTINQQGINAISNMTNNGIGNTTFGAGSSFVNQNFGIQGSSSLATIFTPNSDTLIGLEVDALELQSQGRTISSPRVMTANYQQANIQQGIQIPYQQSSSAGNTNIAFVNATLSLQVTPQITDDGYILLNINIKKDTPNTALVVQGTPSINTHSVTTKVRVRDGSTILVGGIYIDDQQNVKEQVPWLGDIPYLGWLFKVQSTVNSNKELLIFITPRVIINNLENNHAE